MKEIIKHFKQKHKKYNTKDLKVGLEVKTIGHVKNHFGSYSVVYKPKRFTIVSNSSLKLKDKFIADHFGKDKKVFKSVPKYFNAPSYLYACAKYYDTPTHKNSPIPSQTSVLLRFAHRVDDKSYNLLLDDTIQPLEEVLEDSFKLPKKLTLAEIINLEHLINNEELEMK